jgi:hypothetical protein
MTCPSTTKGKAAMSKKKLPCNKCGAELQSYWLKDGTCNACRNPHLVVTCVKKPYCVRCKATHDPVECLKYALRNGETAGVQGE